ncbi:MAG: hypothetical protein FJX72_10050 [Armatimonadetes bacterium]|nr:hypothetical protein [Armatimonadota bacterium]
MIGRRSAPLLAVTGLAVCVAMAHMKHVIASEAKQSRTLGGNPEPTLTVVFSGEMKGYLSPCGCSKPMLGGIARRGAVLKRLARRGPVIAIENGDLTQADGRQDELKAETLADALSAMNYDAIGVGEKDLALGEEFLATLQDRSAPKWLCANVRDASGKSPFAAATRVRRKIGATSRDVLIVSAMAAGRSAEGFTIGDPLAALRRITDRAPIRILLIQGRRQEAEAIARAVPRFALVVYAHGPDTPAPPIRIGKATLVCAGSSGKHLGTATLDVKGAVRRVGSIALGENAGTDAGIEAIRRAYQDRVASENLLDMLPRSPLPSGVTFAGSTACRSCHEAAHAVWGASGHAKAMATLRKVGQDRDPECVPCHAVGVAKEGGYLDRGTALGHVGCENCHGPSGRHVADVAVKPDRSGPKSCAECHVPNHSPGFRYETYWSRIRH